MITLVSVQKSDNPAKKFMAFFLVNGKRKKVHFGAVGYNDFILYQRYGKTVANMHRQRYITRHQRREDWSDPTTAGCLSRYILWEKPTLKSAIAFYRSKFRV